MFEIKQIFFYRRNVLLQETFITDAPIYVYTFKMIQNIWLKVTHLIIIKNVNRTTYLRMYDIITENELRRQPLSTSSLYTYIVTVI